MLAKAPDRIEALGMQEATVSLSVHAVRHGWRWCCRLSCDYPHMVGARGVGAALSN